MAAIFRHRANDLKSRRRIHATILWQYDAADPAVAEPERLLSEVDRRRRQMEYRLPPRWEYERAGSTLRRRGRVSLESSSLTGAGSVSVLFDEAGIEQTFEFSVIGAESTHLYSVGVNL